jgi:hypothetical protein
MRHDEIEIIYVLEHVIAVDLIEVSICEFEILCTRDDRMDTRILRLEGIDRLSRYIDRIDLSLPEEFWDILSFTTAEIEDIFVSMHGSYI